ncbi:MAG: hypothetical protein J7L64_07760 [Acidobacteria bacterium]|nr:hypothetical protein [Acidobacteriota bacterium]
MRKKATPTITVIFTLFLPVAISLSQGFSSPAITFERYKRAIAKGDVEAYLKCLTRESLALLQGNRPPRSLLKKEYKNIAGKEYFIQVKEKMAIVLFKRNTPYEAPYLLLKENNEWKIDLKGMSEKIFFDAEKKWHLLGEEKITVKIPKEEDKKEKK